MVSLGQQEYVIHTTGLIMIEVDMGRAGLTRFGPSLTRACSRPDTLSPTWAAGLIAHINIRWSTAHINILTYCSC